MFSLLLTMSSKPDYDIFFFSSDEEWAGWLEENHNIVPGVWLKFAKKGTGITSLHYPEALDVALCYGWIDGQSKSFDEAYYLQKFTPRGKRSIWSKINTEKAERLITERKMQPAGLQVIEAAKTDGRWEAAYDASSTMVLPDDFLQRLAIDKKAEAFFKTLNKTNIFAIGYRLQTARKPETREKRIVAILTMLHENRKFH